MPLAGLSDPFLKIQFKDDYRLDVSKKVLDILTKLSPKNDFYRRVFAH